MTGKRFFILLFIVIVAGVSCRRIEQKENSPNDSLTIEKLTAKIRENPKNAKYFFQRSKLYFSKKQTEDAIKDIEIAIKLDSMQPEFYTTVAEYYLSTGKSGSSKNYLEKCIRLFPDSAEAFIKLADIYLYVKDYQKSMEYLLKAQEKNRNIAEIYFTKAMIYKEMDDTTRAIDNLLTSVEKNPDYYEGYIELGHMYLLRNDSLAVGFLKNAIRILPHSSEAYYFIGIYYQQNGQFQKAIDYFNSIVSRVDNTYPYAYYNIGYINLVYYKNYNAAIEYFTKAIENKTNYYQAYYNRGYAYELSGQFDMASANYRQSLDLLPNYELAVSGLNRLDKKR
jgi:tetratricopeptide (TPR) repeat protein